MSGRLASSVETSNKTSCMVVGLHALSSRSDLQALLGDVYTEDMSISAVMDSNYMPSGDWMVTFDNADEGEVKKGNDLANQFVLAVGKRNKELKEQNIKVERLAARIMSAAQVKEIATSEDGGIDNRTLRVQRVHEQCDDEMVRYIFQNFRLVDVIPFDITSLKRSGTGPGRTGRVVKDGGGQKSLKEYLVKFESPEEAQRASIVYNGFKCRGIPLLLNWYNV